MLAPSDREDRPNIATEGSWIDGFRGADSGSRWASIGDGVDQNACVFALAQTIWEDYCRTSVGDSAKFFPHTGDVAAQRNGRALPHQ